MMELDRFLELSFHMITALPTPLASQSGPSVARCRIYAAAVSLSLTLFEGISRSACFHP